MREVEEELRELEGDEDAWRARVNELEPLRFEAEQRAAAQQVAEALADVIQIVVQVAPVAEVVVILPQAEQEILHQFHHHKVINLDLIISIILI